MCGWRYLVSSVAFAALVGCGADQSGGGEREERLPALVPEEMPEGLSDEDLSSWLVDRGRYSKALPVVGRIVEERRSGGRGIELAEALMSLGMVHDSLGDSRQALSPLVEAWQLLGEAGASAATMGACADALGLACHGAGEFADAERALLAAIDYREQASPEDPEPWVSASRMHLGRLYLTTARYEEAEVLLREVLESAPDDAAVAARARQLGSYHHTLGAYDQAISLFQMSRDAARRTYGLESGQVAAVVGDLGLSRLRSGDLDGARLSLKSSHDVIASLPSVAPDLVATSVENLATFYTFVGEPEKAIPLLGDPDDAIGFNNLGSAFQMTGRFDSASECFERARALAESELDEYHPLRVQVLQNLACLRSDQGDKDGALAAAREAGSAAVELLDYLLEFGSEAQRLEFRRISDPLSLLCSFGASATEIGEMLRRTKGVVLDSILRDEEGGALAGVLQLPEGQTFADACFYQHYQGRGSWEGRYGAVVDGRWVTLGAERKLRTLLRELRLHIDAAATGAEGSEALLSMEAVLAGLHDFCIRPLGELEDGLVYSPDGDLRFVPFAALMNDGGFLCQQIESFQMVPSGRANTEPLSSSATWALCAIDDYSSAARAEDPGGELQERLRALGDLPGVREEREALMAAKAFRTLPGDKAALLQVLRGETAPGVLHFSCHGIFLGDGARPLARSCLVVADKQPIFPAEIASLRLDGTRLVTLSACDTGLGVSMAGEGVLGLQRGFLMAGAENILMTLWAVGDRELPEFMKAFYGGLSENSEPSAALWSLQRKRLPALEKEEGLARAVWIAGGFSMLGR